MVSWSQSCGIIDFFFDSLVEESNTIVQITIEKRFDRGILGIEEFFKSFITSALSHYFISNVYAFICTPLSINKIR